MSVDLVATLPEPVTLKVLTATAHTILTEMLGMRDLPEFTVRKDGGDPGPRLSEEQLTAVRIGEHIDGAEYGRIDPNRYVIHVDGAGDSAWLMVMDLSGAVKRIEAIFTPTRTCVGVVTATALALARRIMRWRRVLRRGNDAPAPRTRRTPRDRANAVV